jgi:predicted MFS family arabinose efflux permease
MGVFISILSLFLVGKGIRTTDIAFIISATAIFTIAVQPLVGILSDRIKKTKIIIAASMCISLLTGVLFIFIDNVLLLFILNGITQSLIISIMPFYDTLAEKSDYTYGSIRIWGSIGFAVSVQVTGLVYDYVSHNAVFMMFGLSTLLCILTLSPLKEVASTKKKPASSNSLDTLKILVKNKAFILFLLLSFVILGMHYCNIAYMPILVKSMGGTATNVGMILLFQTLFEIPVLLATDKIFKKLSFKTCLIMILTVMAIRFLWYSFLPGTQWITAAFFFQALSTNLFFVLSIKVVLYMIDESLVYTALALGSMLGKGVGALTFQLIGGQLLDRYGVSFLYQFLGAIAIIGIFLSLMFNPAKKPSEC